MNRNRGIIIGVLAIIITVAGFGYWFVLREPKAPSAPIEAIPIEPESEEVVQEEEELPEAEIAQETDAMIPEEPDEDAEAVEVVEDEAPEGPEPVQSAPITWAIDSSTATATFELDEDLRGERVTVIGVSDQVAGQMRFDLNDLSSAEIGIIQVNARSFVTDEVRRNNTIQNRILQTAEYEFITFEPTNIVGLPTSATAGDRVQFDIEGSLTIREVSLPVIFSAAVDIVDQNSIQGTAVAIIVYSDFGINIPDIPIIANVEEELELYLDFSAAPIE